MRLPARTVERAGTGDLTSRATTDVGLVAFVLRDAAPEMLFALDPGVIIITAVVLLSPLLGVVGAGRTRSPFPSPALVSAPSPFGVPGPGAADAEVADVLAATAAGARTVEALGLQQRRRAACACRHRGSKVQPAPDPSATHVLFPTIDVSSALAVGVVFCAGGLLYLDQASVSAPWSPPLSTCGSSAHRSTRC